jgi:hypothetical protein
MTFLTYCKNNVILSLNLFNFSIWVVVLIWALSLRLNCSVKKFIAVEFVDYMYESDTAKQIQYV